MIGKYADILDHPYLALPRDPDAAAEILAIAQIAQAPQSPDLVAWRAQSIATVRAECEKSYTPDKKSKAKHR